MNPLKSSDWNGRIAVALATGALVSLGSAHAQNLVPLVPRGAGLPRTPPAFETRNTGKTGEIAPNVGDNQPAIRKVTYTAVSDLRDWTDKKGRVIHAQLLSHDVEKDGSQGSTQSLVRNGEIRLLVRGKKAPSSLALTSLSEADQEFVRGLDEARQKVAAEKPEEP